MSLDTSDVLLAGLGIGGFLWMNRKLDIERRARVAAEQQRDCARACAARAELRPMNGLKPATTSTPTSKGLAPRTFDPIFAACGQGIPVPYLRALALRESDMNPRESSGPAWGLLQVIEVVRQDYNEHTGAKYTRQDLLDPAINVTIAATALATIVRSYAQNHPRIKNLQADWNNPRFIELLTFGWNAGWSERGGVGRVSKFLEQRGLLDQTLDTIYRASRDAGASPHLANAAKVGWSKSVAAQYFRELAAERPVIEMPEEYVGRPPLVATAPVIEMPPEYVGRGDSPSAGPITHPAQVMTSMGPITHPSQVMTSAGPITHPSQIMTAPNPSSLPASEHAPAKVQISAPITHAPVVTPVSAPVATAASDPRRPIDPYDPRKPINPYDDCACVTT